MKKRDFVSRGPSTGYGWRLDRSVAGTGLSLKLIINIWSESPQTYDFQNYIGMVKIIRIETPLIIKCSNKSSAFEDTSGYIFDHYLFSYQPSPEPYIKAMGVFLYQPCHFRFSKTFCRQLRV